MSLILSHLPPLSMAWNKIGTREEILKVSPSRTLTLARSMANGMGRAPPDLQRIRTVRRQKTGKHPWMKGDFNQAQNVPLKKQQTLLTLYNSVKQKTNHLYRQNIYQIISHTHSTEVNLTLHEMHRPKESKTTWGSGNNTPIQQLRIFQ